MGLNFGLFWQTGVFKRFYFGVMETGGFSGPVLSENVDLGTDFYDGGS